MIGKAEEEEFDDAGDGVEEEKEGGEEGDEEVEGKGGEKSLDDVVAHWEAALGPKYKIIVSTNQSQHVFYLLTHEPMHLGREWGRGSSVYSVFPLLLSLFVRLVQVL